MEDEQAKTLEALKFAIQMEIDGKEYYQRAGKGSGNMVGKELFQWLADAEDRHRQRFEEIYNDVKNKKVWPEVDIQTGKEERLSTLFSREMKAAAPNIKAPSVELDIITKATEMEKKSEDYYRDQGERSTSEAEKKFYEALVAEERGHYLALVDYREYIIDPEGWLRKQEHHSLDGG
ncbi:MAG: ferritin family protein [Deltaproteobacteria bacterium]|nr:MAG: ferritin family protein [Deltaproteobacteria bacterium]